MEELLEMVFFMQSMPRVYKDDSWPAVQFRVGVSLGQSVTQLQLKGDGQKLQLGEVESLQSPMTEYEVGVRWSPAQQQRDVRCWKQRD
jgi:hypothetical protein